ncbi:MAG: hypothetical protein ACRYGG_21690 [Janthinobacterium lividum]
MYIPGPPVRPLIDIQSISTYLNEFENIGDVSGGVGVFGSAAAYAMVWELGSFRLKKPGPKTMWSVNRFGQKVILTKQAPLGYIGVIDDTFFPIIEKELMSVDFSNKTSKRLNKDLTAALNRASKRIADLIRLIAPEDSGDLKAQIQAVNAGDSLLGASSIESAGTIIL